MNIYLAMKKIRKNFKHIFIFIYFIILLNINKTIKISRIRDLKRKKEESPPSLIAKSIRIIKTL